MALILPFKVAQPRHAVVIDEHNSVNLPEREQDEEALVTVGLEYFVAAIQPRTLLPRHLSRFHDLLRGGSPISPSLLLYFSRTYSHRTCRIIVFCVGNCFGALWLSTAGSKPSHSRRGEVTMSAFLKLRASPPRHSSRIPPLDLGSNVRTYGSSQHHSTSQPVDVFQHLTEQHLIGSVYEYEGTRGVAWAFKSVAVVCNQQSVVSHSFIFATDRGNLIQVTFRVVPDSSRTIQSAVSFCSCCIRWATLPVTQASQYKILIRSPAAPCSLV